MPTCDLCGNERNIEDTDYDLSQVISNAPLGWYSSDDGEICGRCMTALIVNQ